MKKLKKVFMSLGIFMTSLISKVSAISLTKQTKYGVFEPTMGEKISSIGKIALPIILFVIGLFVVLSKKITKKVKAIVVSVLIVLAVLGYILMNYIATNF